MERLREANILDAFSRLTKRSSDVALSLASSSHHYHRYRWSVALGEGFREVIHAVPPEEELGWTPWERWVLSDQGRPTHENWIGAAPIEAANRSGWRVDGRADSTDLRPTFHGPGRALRDRLDLVGVSDAFQSFGVDVSELLTSSPGSSLDEYSRCRWAVIPHFLADDGPVVYCIPTPESPNGWPWETWYRAAGTVVHHVHFDRARQGFEHHWAEPIGAPQRPPEVLGLPWFWGDPQTIHLAMT